MTSKIPKPCPKCGTNRWKTLAKKVAWQCRNCGFKRTSKNNTDEDVTPAAKARMA